MGIELDRRDTAAPPDQICQDCRVITHPGADMHGMLAGFWRCARDQRREEGRHAIIQRAFRHDRDGEIVIEINRVTAWCSDIATAEAQIVPTDDLPWPAADKILAPDSRERGFDTPVGDPGGSHDPLGVGLADNLEFGFAVHPTGRHYQTIS